MNPMNLVYALSGLVLFSLYGWAMITYGNIWVRELACLAVLFGAISQFLAQDDRRQIVILAHRISLVAIFVGLLAWCVMVGFNWTGYYPTLQPGYLTW